MNKRFILASQSPRRKELLGLLEIPFETVAPNVEEVLNETLSPENAVLDLAFQKAKDVQKKYPEALILGCDTLVFLDKEVMGKPRDELEAKTMLRKLSGKTHRVITGCALLYRDYEDLFYSTAEVTFSSLGDEEISVYLRTQEPFGKAGAYAIQGYASRFVENVSGDYYTIVGLPIAKIYQKIKELPF